MRTIRVLLLGDSGVGKTSLIQTLLTESFPESVPDVLPEIRIPSEISPDGVETVLVDSSCLPEKRDELEKLIREADVICVVYAVDEMSSFHRLGTHWLPLVRSQQLKLTNEDALKPIILVGNKIDTRGPDVSNEELEDEILPLMSDFKEIETCVECSAKTLINVAEAFYFAQKAVLHPTGPLYDARDHRLKPEASRALERIFRLSDTDADGFLSDTEINAFQMRCFKTPLQREELASIKDILSEAEPGSVSEEGISLSGFLALHRLFIQRGRLETTWSALRAFGYSDQLTLSEAIARPAVKEGSTIVLGPKAYAFLTGRFHAWDRDSRGALTLEQLDELFAPAQLAGQIPWHRGLEGTAQQDGNGCLTLSGFLAQWALMAMLDGQVALSTLSLLGCEDVASCAKVAYSRSQRDTFLVWLIGAKGSGKSSLLYSFLQRDASDSSLQLAVGSVPWAGRERYLVLEAIPGHVGMDLEALADAARLARVDAICYVYDQSDAASLSYIQRLYQDHEAVLKNVPAFLLPAKSDTPCVYSDEPSHWASTCASIRLLPPVSSALGLNLTEALWSPLLGLALEPRQSCTRRSILLPALTVVAAIGATAALLYYRHSHQAHKGE